MAETIQKITEKDLDNIVDRLRDDAMQVYLIPLPIGAREFHQTAGNTVLNIFAKRPNYKKEGENKFTISFGTPDKDGYKEDFYPTDGFNYIKLDRMEKNLPELKEYINIFRERATDESCQNSLYGPEYDLDDHHLFDVNEEDLRQIFKISADYALKQAQQNNKNVPQPLDERTIKPNDPAYI